MTGGGYLYKMKKNEERKLIKQLKESLGDNYQEIDMIIITDVIDWMKINRQAKEDLVKSIEDNGKMDWVALTTISMASKGVITNLKALGLTPSDRLKQRLLSTSKESGIDNLNNFLNG